MTSYEIQLTFARKHEESSPASSTCFHSQLSKITRSTIVSPCSEEFPQRHRVRFSRQVVAEDRATYLSAEFPFSSFFSIDVYRSSASRPLVFALTSARTNTMCFGTNGRDMRGPPPARLVDLAEPAKVTGKEDYGESMGLSIHSRQQQRLREQYPDGNVPDTVKGNQELGLQNGVPLGASAIVK